MKRNKRVKKYSRCAVNSVNAGALLVLMFFAMMVYWAQDAHCNELSQEIGKAEKELKKLESDYEREVSSWDELKTPDNLRQALIRHGIDMVQTNPGQVINMNASGKPMPGQMSVARIRQRQGRVDRVASSQVVPRTYPVAPRAAMPRTVRRSATTRR